MIKTVLLDIDDTILDFHGAQDIALPATFRELGIEPTDEVIRRYNEINREGWQMLERGEITRDEVVLRRFRILFAELGRSEIDPKRTWAIYEEKLSAIHTFIDGAPELLEALFGKYDLYVVSNGTASVQDRRIAESDIGKYFKKLFISERVGYDKPSHEFFDHCFASIDDFSRENTVIIGDSLTSDIQGGINAGILTCHYNPKGLRSDKITPDYDVKSLSEIPALLERI